MFIIASPQATHALDHEKIERQGGPRYLQYSALLRNKTTFFNVTYIGRWESASFMSQ